MEWIFFYKNTHVVSDERHNTNIFKRFFFVGEYATKWWPNSFSSTNYILVWWYLLLLHGRYCVYSVFFSFKRLFNFLKKLCSVFFLTLAEWKGLFVGGLSFVFWSVTKISCNSFFSFFKKKKIIIITKEARFFPNKKGKNWYAINTIQFMIYDLMLTTSNLRKGHRQ